tara:strand:- start:689 stop:1477 length:789 start_codon:yes stop_codon:yes gene_type:complete
MKIISANLNVIIKACEKASKSLIRDFGEIEKLQVSVKGPADFVSSADKKVEETLISELQRSRPDYSILSEEIGEIKKNSSYRWIIDPIDGTLNFLHGIPHFAISVALEKENEIICGVIFDPIKDEIFLAEKDQGSYLNNHRLRVSKRKKFEDCLILTGGPSYKDLNKNISFDNYIKISKLANSPIRKMGSASLDMAYIAAGRADGFFQKGLSYWDIAAGIILVKEAGGIISDFDGNSNFIEDKNIIASNTNINTDLIDLLNK